MIKIHQFSLSNLAAAARCSRVVLYDRDAEDRDCMIMADFGCPSDGDRNRRVIAHEYYSNPHKVNQVTKRMLSTTIETAALLSTISKMQELDGIILVTLSLPRNDGELRIFCTTSIGEDRIFVVPAVDYEKPTAPPAPPNDESPHRALMAAIRSSVIVDQPKGSYKQFREPGGKLADYPIEGMMYAADYGHLPGYRSEDGEDLDVFVGNTPDGEYGKFRILRPDVPIGEETIFYLGLSHKEMLEVRLAFHPVITRGPWIYNDIAICMDRLTAFEFPRRREPSTPSEYDAIHVKLAAGGPKGFLRP